MFLLALPLLAALALWARRELIRPAHHNSADRTITIRQGSGARQIVAQLAGAGIVHHPGLLLAYIMISGRGRALKAGDYRFESPISPLEAIGKIERGEVYFERVTIAEGLNRFEIAKLLAERTNKASAEEFLRLMDDARFISKIAPEARNLEGYLFPDTYSYTSSTTPEELIQMMVRRFDEVFKPEWYSRASQLGLTLHQVVTLASIIEEEARLPEDRPLIASVLMNRLKLGMPLAADPTFIYAAMIAGDWDGNPNHPRHRHRDSPYNTYIYSGLPPGPISSPGRASIEAALYPAQTDYLYFVLASPDGKHKFSRTAAEHEAAVAEYRRWQHKNRTGL
jgi:UPF0755 protein